MYSANPGLILGFHGCDIKVRNEVIMNTTTLNPSSNTYDWLGNGIYFWENNSQRALKFAEELRDNPLKSKKSSIKTPSVLGAIIDLGNCLDLLDSEYLDLVKESYKNLVASYNTVGLEIPQNLKGRKTDELLVRNLDCAVIENLHKNNKVSEFDSVRGVFVEGQTLYPTCGFNEKNHIQICIRNPNCIKGFFLPREINKGYNRV